MKLIKIIPFVFLLFLSCDKEVIYIYEEDEICECSLITEEIFVNTSGNLPFMDVRTTIEPYSNDCNDDNKIIYQDNKTTKIVRCK